MKEQNTMIPSNDIEGQVILYQPNDTIHLEVKLDHDTVWLTQQQMVELFQSTKQNVSLHINNIFKEGELTRKETVKEYLTVQKEGARSVKRKISYYNLDVIISVGYRVKSQRGTQFRIWATSVLKDHLLNGYSINRQLIALQERTDERFSGIQQQLNEQKQKVDFLVKMHKHEDEQLFPTGCIWDAYTYMASLIRTAKEQVILIDNYCNDKTLNLLDERMTGVKAMVHTTYNKKFEDALAEHNKQYAAVEFIQIPHKIHDRFLIIDKQVYLLGNSLKDMGHTLSAVILTAFTPDEVINRLK